MTKERDVHPRRTRSRLPSRARRDAADAAVRLAAACAQRTGVDVVIKHENHTPTGAFKVRGGIVYVDRLKRERPHVKGVITATRGNHGQSLAFACGARRRRLHGGGAVRQFDREERRHEGVRRRADRARPRLRRGARARGRDRGGARLRIRQVVRQGSGARRRDLRARAVHRRAGARRGVSCRSGSAPASAA